MPPPDTASNHSGPFLRRTQAICLYGGRVCGTGWLLFMCWVLWTRPDRLGPGRMIGGLALASITATCTVLWWLSTLRLKERLDGSLNAATGLTAAVNGTIGQVRHLGDNARR